MKPAYMVEVGMELLEGAVLSHLATVERATIPEIRAHLFPDLPAVANIDGDRPYGVLYHVLHRAVERGKVAHARNSSAWSLAEKGRLT